MNSETLARAEYRCFDTDPEGPCREMWVWSSDRQK